MSSKGRSLAVFAGFFLASILTAQPVRQAPSMTIAGAFGSLSVDSFSGDEALSAPFDFVFTMSSDAPIAFDTTLGTEVTMTMTQGQAVRRFSGMCERISERANGARFAYEMEVVPKLALLQLDQNSRIFQNKTVPEILQAILAAQGITNQVQLTATYSKRDFVVQYRESDFNFISRLMEEEGIYYYFTYGNNSHTLVISDSAASNPTVNGDVQFLPAGQTAGVQTWRKSQQLVPGNVTVRDFNFELPDNNLEASQPIQDSVAVGTVTHKLALAATSALDVYDYPGGYAKRFDGVPDVQNVFTDNRRVAGTRMQEIAASAIRVDGTSSVTGFSAGSRFNLTQHPNANGQYLLTMVHHEAGRGTGPAALRRDYQNTFTALPSGLPFRPARTARRPVIGDQTATVVGPPGEVVFTDKYGRVKVQFHWDREGKNDANSSAWIRVGSLHAGQETGFAVAPRIGEEVIVAFLEGDPDQPIIIGSAYNPRHLPPPPQ